VTRALAGTLTALALIATAEAGPSRADALTALTAADVEARRFGAAGLLETGTMADAPALVAALRDSDAQVRGLAEAALWAIWSRSGDTAIDSIFEIGVAQMREGRVEASVDTFSEIIRRRPDFAEGWNKRATVYYLLGQYDKSLSDCDEVMKRNPVHFGALAGYGQIYLRLNQPEKALLYFERALAVNPNMEQVEAMIEQLKSLLLEKRKGTI
jgi:tetratricopeptide (TPR) repeat protein